MKCKSTKSFDPLCHLLQDFLQEMKKIVDMINYEIEYVLRPHTAPARFSILILVITIHYHGHEHHHNCRHHIFELWTKGTLSPFLWTFKGKTLLPDSGQRKEQNPRERWKIFLKKKNVEFSRLKSWYSFNNRNYHNTYYPWLIDFYKI